MLRDIDPDTDMGLVVAGVGGLVGNRTRLFIHDWESHSSVKNLEHKCEMPKTWHITLFLSHVHCTIKPKGED